MPVAFSLCLPIAIPSAWAIPGRPDYYILHFQDLVESTITVRQKEKGETGCPGATPRGRAALKVPLPSHDLVTIWAHPGDSQQGVQSHEVLGSYNGSEPGGPESMMRKWKKERG